MLRHSCSNSLRWKLRKRKTFIPSSVILTQLHWVNFCIIKAEIQGKRFYVKCEVFNSSAKSFKDAVQYYDPIKNNMSESPTDNSTPVYKMLFSCQDNSTKIDKSGRISDIWLFSFDGQGSDFLSRVDLNLLDGLSTLKQENLMFEKRMNEILESEDVKMTVEVLNDGKGNRALRALNVKC